MKRTAFLLSLIFICITTPSIYAEPSLELSFYPEAKYNQLWAYETYLVNVSINSFEPFNFSYVTDPVSLLYRVEIQWQGKGSYDFGSSTTGYNIGLMEKTVNLTTPLEANSVSFNFTNTKDYYELGRLPYETIEVQFIAKVFPVFEDGSLGPQIASCIQTYVLIDETKVSYLEGKQAELIEEINTALKASGLEKLNRERYQGIIEAMNASMTEGNYVEALDIWQDYDEDNRCGLIKGIIRAAESEYAELQTLRQVAEDLRKAETTIDQLKSEYEHLEATYGALANAYNKVNLELEATKRNLTTAITAIFAAAILFYFIGTNIRHRRQQVA